MVVKDMYFEQRECAEHFLATHCDNVYVMDIKQGKNPEHIHITIDIIDKRYDNVLVGVNGAIIKRLNYE